MNLKELTKLSLDDFYWNLVFGRSQRKANILELRKNKFNDLPAPVFFLSPGRSGTNWFTALLSKVKSVKAFHEPKPNMALQAKLAYEMQNEYQNNVAVNKLLKEVFISGREQILRYSYKANKRYIETNNHLTFFAHVLADLLPQATFVHLNRHPGDFVRSAIRRSYYNNNIEDLKRIVPLPGSQHFKDWGKLSLISKNAWLWSATNEFIEDFKSNISNKRIFYYDFSAHSTEQVENLISFLNLDIKKREISKMIDRKKNIQKEGEFARYSQWSDAEKEELNRIVGPLLEKYHYEL